MRRWLSSTRLWRSHASDSASELDRGQMLVEIGRAQFDLAQYMKAIGSLSAARELLEAAQVRPTPDHADALMALGRPMSPSANRRLPSRCWSARMRSGATSTPRIAGRERRHCGSAVASLPSVAKAKLTQV